MIPITNIETGTSAQQEAVKLHCKIRANLETAAEAIVGFCVNLKEMRDRKLYLELGHDNFGQYCEVMLGIKERQAYNYISTYERLGKDFLRENETLGITKLQLLAAVSSDDREKIMTEHDVDSMSLKELREARNEIERLKEQITLFEEQKNEVEENLATPEFDPEIIEAEVREKLSQEFESRLAEETRRAAADAKSAAKAIETELGDKIEAEKKKAEEAEKKAKDAEDRAAAVEKNSKSAIEAVKRAEELEMKFAAEQARSARLEKEMQKSTNPILTKFGFKFSEFQSLGQELLGLIGELDEENAKKCRKALAAAVGGLGI